MGLVWDKLLQQQQPPDQKNFIPLPPPPPFPQGGLSDYLTSKASASSTTTLPVVRPQLSSLIFSCIFELRSRNFDRQKEGPL